MYEKYARLRDERGLTDYMVAKEAGLSTATLSNWKNGRYTPKVDKMLRIAAVLNVPLEQIVEPLK